MQYSDSSENDHAHDASDPSESTNHIVAVIFGLCVLLLLLCSCGAVLDNVVVIA